MFPPPPKIRVKKNPISAIKKAKKILVLSRGLLYFLTTIRKNLSST